MQELAKRRRGWRGTVVLWLLAASTQAHQGAGALRRPNTRCARTSSRHLAQVYFERLPDAKTLIRLSVVIGADRRWKPATARWLKWRAEQGLIKRRLARVDTTASKRR